MESSTHSERPERRLPISAKSDEAFTLTELLVVLAVVGFLAVTLLPALAATKHNSKLVQCQSNLRQIGAACAMYADDFNTWFPIVSVGSANSYGSVVNHLQGMHYTRYVYQADSGQDGIVMPRFIQPSASIQKGFQDQNLGYLYADGLIGDGRAIFCPSFNDVTDPNSLLYDLSAHFYSNPQFMSTHVNGAIRSSYMFNPRMVNPAGGNNLRRYQKADDVHQRDVFALDYLAANGSGGLGTTSIEGVPFNPDDWAHWPGKGLNTLFTDGSAKFCTITNAALFSGIVNYLHLDDGTTTSLTQYNTIFNALRDAP